ncbi:MAG TPA: tetratricopeptide repeat protein [Verrucomicrobiae bacterium]|nr:tetratricopeptide repeat protein [Verrucomicrobiae bacterium]
MATAKSNPLTPGRTGNVPPGRGFAPPIPRTPPLFRRIDWLAFLITFAAVWIGYYLTLAPELTLEDSGELATGSFYAGIPHPPGYPVWTIYTWLWTVLVPIKNAAWRVALGEATGGALAAGLLAFIVSRGSSLLMEGIDELKAMAGRWESAICVVSGFVAGMLIGFNGFMWSQSVIVEVYSFSIASLMIVLLCILRWVYAPHQKRYLYLALFFHGICFTNHQTLIVAAMGIEVAIAAAHLRMGRYLWLGNIIIYFGAWILAGENILTALESNHAVFIIFHVVGAASIALYLWFAVLTKITAKEIGFDASLALFFLALPAAPALGFFGWALAVAGVAGGIKFGADTWRLGHEWLAVMVCGFCWIAGASFYFYMPLAGMTNPPMEWGYPRTVEGFFHAFTRGQYEKTNPTDIIHDPLRFLTQLTMLGTGIIEEFNWVYAFLALVPFVFFFKLHRRERAWLIGITAIYLCLGVLLLILLNPPPDRAAQELVRVFFTASHTLIALLIGYGLTLIAAFMATQYQRFRAWGLTCGAVALALALYSFTDLTGRTFFGETANVPLSQLLSFVGQTFTNKDQYGLPVYAGLILVAMALTFLCALVIYRKRAPLAVTLGLFALMPLYSILTHWSDNEERNHWFGYYFGHDMFHPPFKAAGGKGLYPEMAKNAVLFGGTDPGRFCPTYMIFCDSFIPHNCQPAADQSFDRRDVYIITQNALADGTYLDYIRAQYNRSAQIDPPFFQELFRSEKERTYKYTNFLARAVRPLDVAFEGFGARVEKRRRTYTSWFSESDFIDLPRLAGLLRAQQDPVSSYIYQNLLPETRALLTSSVGGAALRRGLATDLNALIDRELEVKKQLLEKKAALGSLQQAGPAGRLSETDHRRVQTLETQIEALQKLGPLYAPARFQQVHLSEYLQDFIRQNPQSDTRVRLNRLLIEAAYPQEIAKSLGGVYPDREIYCPTAEDSARCFSEYMADAQHRLQLNEIKPGEDVHYDPRSGRIQISGHVAVMEINGLLTKVIFDHNPKNEFYVEESFPLDWMYPYLTPFGIIMELNRQPLPELTDEIVRRDHEFWTKYSDRLIGNWITYDTPIKDIAGWVEKVYLRRDFAGYTGDRKFIRDDQAQKSFSKLRSAIAGVYAWRLSKSKPGTPEHQRMSKEADFAFRQAFGFCPYSPEVLFRYVNLLLGEQRLDEALIIATTCLELDPYNGGVIDLVKRLRDWKAQHSGLNSTQLETEVAQNPDNFQLAFNLASVYLQTGQTGHAVQTLARVLNNPHADADVLRALVPAFASLVSPAELKAAVNRLAGQFQTYPTNLQAGIGLAEGYRDLQETGLAAQTLQHILDSTNLDPNTALLLAQQYAASGNYSKLKQTLQKLAKLTPGTPEVWYDLAALKATLGKMAQALPALRQAITLSNQRLKQDPKARDLRAEAAKDPRFAALRDNPQFKELTK